MVLPGDIYCPPRAFTMRMLEAVDVRHPCVDSDPARRRSNGLMIDDGPVSFTTVRSRRNSPRPVRPGVRWIRARGCWRQVQVESTMSMGSPLMGRGMTNRPSGRLPRRLARQIDDLGARRRQGNDRASEWAAFGPAFFMRHNLEVAIEAPRGRGKDYIAVIQMETAANLPCQQCKYNRYKPSTSLWITPPYL